MSWSASITPAARSSLLALVEERSQQKVMSCYQCGKCTAGCPVAAFTRIGPRRVMRAVQLGLRPVALANDLIWLCLSCQTCSVRCPREIEVAAVMESLRLIAVAEGVRPPSKDLATFHRVFLSTIKRGGRLHEFALAALYNLLSFQPLKNSELLPGLFSRGKLGLLPDERKGAAEVQGIFERVAAIEGRELDGGAGPLAASTAIANAIGTGILAGTKALRGRRAEAKQ